MVSRFAIRAGAVAFAAALLAELPVGSSGVAAQPAGSAHVLGSAHHADTAQDPVIEVDLMRLTNINWEPGADVPEDIRALHGRRVVLRGFMHMNAEEDARTFPLVSESCQCSAGLLVHHFVEVDLGPNGRVRRMTGQFEVIGRFEVGEQWDDGFLTSLYRLKGRVY